MIVPAEGGDSQNGDDDSSDSEADEPSLSQEPKAPSNPSTGGGSQPGSAVHRPRGTVAARQSLTRFRGHSSLMHVVVIGPSGRAGASWSMDSSSDDSHRWSDTLSIDEKDGFIFVNYSEGQTKVPHPAHLAHPSHLAHAAHPGQSSAFQPSAVDARTYNQLRTGRQPGSVSVRRDFTTEPPSSSTVPSPLDEKLAVCVHPGYRWERQLVFRSKLTMHTAFDRKDNAHPAEITSLAISK